MADALCKIIQSSIDYSENRDAFKEEDIGSWEIVHIGLFIDPVVIKSMGFILLPLLEGAIFRIPISTRPITRG